MVDLLDEAREELRQEKVQNLINKFAKPVLILVAVLFGAGLLKVWYDNYKTNIIMAEGARHFEGVMSARAQDFEKALQNFADNNKGQSNYSALSGLQQASLLNAQGKLNEAEDIYRKIAKNNKYASALRDFAGYMILHTKAAKGDYSENLLGEINDYLKSNPVFSCSATELKALTFYNLQKKEDAISALATINSKECPEDMVLRTKRLSVMLLKNINN
jgi:hypothetical protein